MKKKTTTHPDQLILPDGGQLPIPYTLVNKNAPEKVVDAVFPQDLKYLRPTQVAVLLECPKRWAAEVLHGMGKDEPTEFSSDNVPDKPSAGQVGTAMHQVIEDYTVARHRLTGHEELVGTPLIPLTHPAVRWITPEERPNLQRCIEEQVDLRGELPLAVELEFVHPWKDGCPPVKGHIDRLSYKEVQPIIVIQDYKSNRAAESVEEWRRKAQQRLYAMAVRAMYPGYQIMWRIIYINLGYNLEWMTEAEDDIEILERLNNAWHEVMSTPQADAKDISAFRENVTEGCHWCPLKNQCKSYKTHTELSRDSLLTMLPPNPIDRWEKLKLVEKLVADELKVAKAAALDQLSKSGGTLAYNGKQWFAEYGSKRQLSFEKVWPTLLEVMVEHPDLYQDLIDTDAVTLKVTSFDKLMKKHGADLVDKLAPLFDTVTSEEPTIKSAVKGKAVDALTRAAT